MSSIISIVKVPIHALEYVGSLLIHGVMRGGQVVCGLIESAYTKTVGKMISATVKFFWRNQESSRDNAKSDLRDRCINPANPDQKLNLSFMPSVLAPLPTCNNPPTSDATTAPPIAFSLPLPSQQSQIVRLHSAELRKELEARGVFLYCNGTPPDQIDVNKEILDQLPKGHYYTVLLPTCRLHEQIDKESFKIFIQNHPEGIILTFSFVKVEAAFKQYIKKEYESPDGSPKVPVCTLFFPPNDASDRHNLQAVQALREIF